VSFKIEPKRCMPFIQSIISRMDSIFGFVTQDKIALFTECLQRMFAAMESEDFVLLRDILVYELKPLLVEACLYEEN
jgi:hypothetical protein